MLFLIRLQSSISFFYNVDIFYCLSLLAHYNRGIYILRAHNLHKYSAAGDDIIALDIYSEAYASPKMDQLLWIV